VPGHSFKFAAAMQKAQVLFDNFVFRFSVFIFRFSFLVCFFAFHFSRFAFRSSLFALRFSLFAFHFSLFGFRAGFSFRFRFFILVFNTNNKTQQGKSPVLLRIEKKAGHGAGTPTTKVIEEVTDKYSFLIDIFKMKTDAIPWLQNEK
jgi:hypothetical protein